MDKNKEILKANISLKVINARLGCSKECLDKSANQIFRIKFSLTDNTNSHFYSQMTKPVQLKDSLMFFTNEDIIFNDASVQYDYISIKFITSIPNDDQSLQEYSSPIRLYLSNLEQDIEKDEVYTFTMQNLINIKYRLRPVSSYANEEDMFLKYKSRSIITLNKPMLSHESMESIPEVKRLRKSTVRIEEGSKKDEYVEGNFRASPIKKRSGLLKYFRSNKKDDLKRSNIFSQICGSDENNNNIIGYQSPVNDHYPTPWNKDLNMQFNLLPLEKAIYEVIESNFTITDPNNIYSRDYISKINYSTIDYATFINSIFISGLSYDNTNMIPHSNEYPSPCQHEQCSILSSFQPSLLWKYQNPNKKHLPDLTDLTTNLCFPLGIKVCYMGSNTTKHPSPYNTFLNVIKNERGEMFYIVTLHYFRMVNIDNYDKTYKVNPLREYTKVINSDHIQADQVKFALYLKIISSFITTENVYVPESITLVSRFPFINQMETCLKEMIKYDRNDLEGVIMHLVNELPIPMKMNKIRFYIPKHCYPIDLASPFMPNADNSSHAKVIFGHFSIENIIFIFNMILLDQKLLFIENDYKILGGVSYAFMCFIYPFTLVNTYIPVLSLTTVKFLQSIIPFIMGIDDFLLKYAIENDCIDDNSKIIYIRINSNTLSLSPSHKKKHSKKQILKELSLPSLPEAISDFLTSKLKELKKLYQEKGAIEAVEEGLKETFVEAMARMIGDYQSHMFITDNEAPLFNSESYVNKKEKSDRRFFRELIQTQLFSQFLLNEKHLIGLLAKKEENGYGVMTDNCMIDTRYFNKVYDDYVKRITVTKKSTIGRSNSLVRSQSIGRNMRDSNIDGSNNPFKSSKTMIKRNDSSTQLSFHDHEVSLVKDNLSIIMQNNNTNHTMTKEIVPILIAPYFISNSALANDPIKIEEYILNSSKDQSFSMNTLPEYILNDIQSHSSIAMRLFSDFNDNYRRYFLSMKHNHNHIHSSLDKLTSKGGALSHRNAVTSNNLMNAMKADAETKEISEWFGKICTAEMKNRFKLIDISTLMRLESNRTFFSKLIKQTNTINSKTHTHKILNPPCFTELLRSIKSALSNIEMKEVENCMSLTITCFSYYKITDKKTVYLYEEYINTYQPCRLWLTIDFWDYWFNHELSNQPSTIDNDDSNTNEEPFKSIVWRLLLKVEDIMFKLQMKKDYVQRIIIDTLAKTYLEEEYLSDFEEEYKLRRSY